MKASDFALHLTETMELWDSILHYINYPAIVKLNKYPCHRLKLIRLIVKLNWSIWGSIELG